MYRINATVNLFQILQSIRKRVLNFIYVFNIFKISNVAKKLKETLKNN